MPKTPPDERERQALERQADELLRQADEKLKPASTDALSHARRTTRLREAITPAASMPEELTRLREVRPEQVAAALAASLQVAPTDLLKSLEAGERAVFLPPALSDELIFDALAEKLDLTGAVALQRSGLFRRVGSQVEIRTFNKTRLPWVRWGSTEQVMWLSRVPDSVKRLCAAVDDEKLSNLLPGLAEIEAKWPSLPAAKRRSQKADLKGYFQRYWTVLLWDRLLREATGDRLSLNARCRIMSELFRLLLNLTVPFETVKKRLETELRASHSL